MKIPENGPLDGKQDVLHPFCTDQFLAQTLVYTDPAGALMGPEEDLLGPVRARGERLLEVAQENAAAHMDDENALADAIREVFVDLLDTPITTEEDR